MATTYKTPGVYIEEISKLPPSVAQVETAIPAFIGYTEKATNKIKGDLKGVPTRITSMLEYETYFGAAKPEISIGITINDTLLNGVTKRDLVVTQPASREPFLMYYSMQLYFANGGGPCYIVSVGRYGTDLDDDDTQVTSINNSDDFNDGLAEVGKVDEVTLLVFPDATALSTPSEFYSLYNDALAQCNKLQDRFTIIDTLSYDAASPTDSNIADLRKFISADKAYLKYGAAYYPFLKTILNYQFDAKKIIVSHYSYDATAYETIDANVTAIESPASGLPATVADLVDLTTTPGDISGAVSDVLLQMYSASGFDLGGTFSSDSTKKTAFLDAVEALLGSLGELNDFKSKLNTEAKAASDTISDEDQTIADGIDAALVTFNADFEGAGKIDEVYSNLQELFVKMQNADTSTKIKNLLDVNAVNFDAELKKLEDYTPLNTQTGITSNFDAFANLVTNMNDLITEIRKVEGKDKNNGAMNGRSLNAVQQVDDATYNKILTEIGNLPLELPPSAAMAGVYARVDGERGVWKAPANVSLNYVSGLTVKVTNDIQDDLNVHTQGGKSINAIRAFTGKGILVWGARTLAGNDNEWRYISVRRFFNMVEESVQKATGVFVFEPNDANTWVKVKAMIDNYLINQWKAGALAGTTPEQAFYVKVGLGETMTAQDILNGYMIIEIGMAAVRPAEFIVLQFSHKMQEV